MQTRRKRGRGDERDKASKAQTSQIEMENGAEAEDGAEDDEAVRCICGHEEYPGPPPLGDEDTKLGIKEGIEENVLNPADVTEDLAGFFLQCDVCKVWQHGGCVGIMNEDTSPEEYFCEECRKDLHKIYTAPNGYVFSPINSALIYMPLPLTSADARPWRRYSLTRLAAPERTEVDDKHTLTLIFSAIANIMERRQRYSHYLPIYQGVSRTTSRAASFSKDGTRSPRGSKNGRPSSSVQSAKRRSTMNSRDAAYDEEEQLRRAIEASKGEKSGESTDGGTRRAKRGRSDSEEYVDLGLIKYLS